eukprot:SAG11_NODE_3680_length_2288_cov_2.822750_4_plen_86_part_00
MQGAGPLQVQLHAGGDIATRQRPCEWCGLKTGDFCETYEAPRASEENGWTGGTCFTTRTGRDSTHFPDFKILRPSLLCNWPYLIF